MSADSFQLALPLGGLLLDAAGTLLHPARPVAETYAAYASAYLAVDAATVRERFGAAMREHRHLRKDDPEWRSFWARVVAETTGVDRPALVDALYDHYARADAWTVAAGAEACCRRARDRGLKVGLVSNWDRRLRGLLEQLGAMQWLDTAVVSGEEGVEKPDPAIFERACARLGIEPAAALHVGDSDDDVDGALAAGCRALRFGHDVASFEALSQWLDGLHGTTSWR